MSKNQKKVWITGASSGIGKAVAEKFASKGWKVAVSARTKAVLDQMSKNQNMFSFPLDVTDQAQIKKSFDNILTEFGDLDLCIFSSGTYDPKDESKINSDKIRNVINVNFFGVIDCVKVVEDHFKNKKSGHISIVSSIAGYRGLPNSSGYGPSKAALTNFAESIYFDFKKYGVRVSIISPGFIKTPLTDKNEFPMPFLKTPDYAAEYNPFNSIVKNVIQNMSTEEHIELAKKFDKVVLFDRRDVEAQATSYWHLWNKLDGDYKAAYEPEVINKRDLSQIMTRFVDWKDKLKTISRELNQPIIYLEDVIQFNMANVFNTKLGIDDVEGLRVANFDPNLWYNPDHFLPYRKLNKGKIEHTQRIFPHRNSAI